MFEFQGKLEHLLVPQAYFSPDWFDRERSFIFHRSWMFFCLADQLAKPDDRFARDFYGMPVVAWNHNGTLYALRNVCGHRHSQIVRDGCSQGETLKCQIHGWEYDCAGKLSKIPDGRHLRVIKAPDFALGSYRIVKSGPFIFVNMSNDGPEFEEYLGTLAPEYHRFYDNLRLVNIWTSDHNVNWKIIVENGVESYHVPVVHPTTFQDFREEEYHDHRLEPTYTRYGDLYPYESEKTLEALGFRYYINLLIKNPTQKRFTHTHLFPTFALYYGDIYSALNLVEPLGPERTRFTSYSFVPDDVRWGVFGTALQKMSMPLFVRKFKQILTEDASLWLAVQKGLKASVHRGVISAREERVYAFQRYIVEQLGMDLPLEDTEDLCLPSI
jgi:choline monooxygenase